MSIDIRLPLGPFRDALSTVVGAIVALLLASLVAGAIPTVFTYWGELSWTSFLWTLGTAWIGHWIIVGIFIFGVLFAFLQIIAFHALIYSHRDPLFILALAFANQTFISTIALLIYTKDSSDHFTRALAVGSFLLSLISFSLWKLHKMGYSRAVI